MLDGRGPKLGKKGWRAAVGCGPLDRERLNVRDRLAVLEELGEVLSLVPEPAFGDDGAARGEDLLLAMELGVNRLSREVEGVEVTELDRVVGVLGVTRERDVRVAPDHALERYPFQDAHVLDAPPEFREEDLCLLAKLEVRAGSDTDVRGSRLGVVHLRFAVHVGEPPRVFLEPDLLDRDPFFPSVELDVHEAARGDLYRGSRKAVLGG